MQARPSLLNPPQSMCTLRTRSHTCAHVVTPSTHMHMVAAHLCYYNCHTLRRLDHWPCVVSDHESHYALPGTASHRITSIAHMPYRRLHTREAKAHRHAYLVSNVPGALCTGIPYIACCGAVRSFCSQGAVGFRLAESLLTWTSITAPSR